MSVTKTILSSVRAAELAEMRRFEAAGIQRPFGRLRVWLGEEDEARKVGGGVVACAATAEGRWATAMDLGSHIWIYRVRMAFDVAPGNYELYYCCDLSGQYGSAADVPEAEWVRICAGKASVVPRLCAGLASSQIAESLRGDAHEQPALFGRFVRVVSDVEATVQKWSVTPDRYVDLTSYLGDDLSHSDRSEFSEGRFGRPEMTVALKVRDGAIEAYLHDYARVTYEVGYFGSSWERPTGFEASGYWPRFTGYVRRLDWREPENMLQVTLRAGRREVEDSCTLPLVERKPVRDYLREVVLMDDETGMRLCGAAEEIGVGVATQTQEYVGETREFGSNWFSPVVAVDANDERVYGVCWTGDSFVGVVLKENQATESYESDFSLWYLVRWDAAGREVERKALARRISATYVFDPAVECVRRVLGDIALVGDKLLIAEAHRSLKLSEQRLGYGSNGLLEVPARDWSGLGEVGDYAANPSGIAPGATWRGLSIVLPFGRIPCWVATRPDGGYCVGILRNDRSSSRELVDIDFWSANGVWEQMLEGVALDRYRVAVAACGTATRFWLAVTGASWIGHQGSDPGLQEDWVDRAGFDFAADANKANGVQWIECAFDGTAWTATIGADVPSDYLYTGLCEAGGDVLAFGFGESGGQELARVCQFQYAIESGSVLSAAAGERAVNWRQPEIWIDGEVRSLLPDLNGNGQEVSLARDRGTVALLRPFGDGLEIRANYDYMPTVDLVAVTERVRWDVIGQVCQAFGLFVRMDEVGRVVWGAREVEELFVAQETNQNWLLGISIDPEGLVGIVADSVTVTEATEEEGEFVGIDVATQEVVPVAARKLDRDVTRYELRVTNTTAGIVYRVRYRVQDAVPELHQRARSRSVERDSERVLTRVVVRSPRRVPSDLAQRMETVLKIGPRGYAAPSGSNQELATSKRSLEAQFARVVPARLNIAEWKPKQKVFERPDEAEQSAAQIEFNDPLLAGTVRVLVREMRLPELAKQVTWSITSVMRYRKVDLTTTADHVNYGVWISNRQRYRVCTAADFADMNSSNVQGGAGNVPASADDVKTVDHFYVKRMNLLGAGAAWIVAAHEQWVEYSLDAEGRLVRGVAAAKAARELLLRLRPEDETGFPLLRESPHWIKNWDKEFADMQCAVVAVQVLPDGVRIGVESEARVANRLGVEIVGYPVTEAEVVSAPMRDLTRERQYGRQEQSFENGFVPGYAQAERLAAGILRRSATGRSAGATTRLSAFVRPGDVGWVTDSGGVRTLCEIESVRTRESLGGSETEVRVK